MYLKKNYPNLMQYISDLEREILFYLINYHYFVTFSIYILSW